MSRIEEVLKRASREQINDDATTAAAARTEPAEAEAAWDFDQPASEPEPLQAPAETVFAAIEADEPSTPADVAASVAAEPPQPADVPGAPSTAPALILQRVEAHADPNVLITRTSRFDAIEQYRKLAASLHEAQAERGLRTVLCTSAVMGEGKTVTACNLALTLSESYGRRVLLIDADLRRPQVHAMFGISNQEGLGDALNAEHDGKLSVHQVSERLAIVPAGRPSSNPMTGLTSGRLRDVIAEASQRFDWVIVDTPPVLLLPDARVLVSMVDAVLLVVRAGSTPFRTVLRAVDVIKRDRIFGTVLNSVEDEALDAAYGYERYYGAARTA